MKLLKIFIFGLMVILISFLNNVYSLSGWLYYRPILINNTQNPNNLTNYPILVTLDTQSLISQGKMRSDCGDIRFTDSDGNTLLNYWIEPNTCNTNNTKIWVNVPSIPGGSTKTIYLFYENPSATSMSNGYLVFTFFEDFQNGTAGWTPILLSGSGSASAVWIQSPYGYAGGIRLWDQGGGYASTAALVKNISISDNSVSYCFNAYAMWSITTRQPAYENYAIIISATNGTDTKTVAYRLIVGGDPCSTYWTAFSGTCGNKDYLCTPPDTWINISTNLTNDFLSLCNFRIWNITQISLNVGIWYRIIYGYATNIIIRKCVSPEPSVIVGPQYMGVTISSIQLNPSSSSTVCPGTQTSSTVTVNFSNPLNTSVTVNFSCLGLPGIACSFSPSSCITSGSSCSTTLYVNSYTSLSSLPSGWYPIFITNTQSISTPSPFQQQIAICNGTINIGPNFAYVNNVTLFNLINNNGSNVYFTTTCNSTPNIYSWYLGQFISGSTYCKIWWIKLDNGIPANSNVTIYMYIGNSSSNFYQQYYPYVGVSPQVDPSRQYDNGKYVFIVYGYFNNTTDGWTTHVYNGTFTPTATPYGIQMLNNDNWQGTYILPPNNWNIPLIPLIVEEAWYYTSGGEANVIALFGNTSQQFYASGIASPIASYYVWCGGTNITGGNYNTCGGFTPAPNLSTYVQFQYGFGGNPPYSKAVMLKSAVTYQYLNYISFPTSGGTVYSYLIVNSTYAQAGYYIYNSGQVWAPLTLLNMYHLSYNPNYGNYTYSNLNYNPYQYGTLEIGAGSSSYASYQYIQWVVARAYPPNGVMPSFSIQFAVSVSSVQLNPSSSSPVCPGIQTSSTVTVNLNNPGSTSTTVTFSCSAPSGITCSLNPSSCTTSGSSCSTTLYVNSSPTTPSGSYSVTVTASTSVSSVSATYTYNIEGLSISISSQQSSNFQNSYSIYITGYCVQNYTLYVNNSPYCYDSYSQPININSLCTVSYPGSYSVYAQGCYSGTCVNSNTINLNIPSLGITVPIIDINILNITNQNVYVTISVNGSNQNIQSINVYYNNNNVYSNNNVNTNYYSFNLQLPYSNNGNITVCSTLTNGQSGCVTEIFNLNVAQTYIYYGIIQLQATIQPININTTYGPIGNNLEFSLDSPEYILTLNITNIGNMTLNNITINLQQLGNVPEILYNGIPIGMSNNININQLQPNQSYILQFNVLPLYIGSSSLLLNFNVNGQNIGNAQYNLIVNGPSNKSSLIASENINYILILLGIIGSIIFLI